MKKIELNKLEIGKQYRLNDDGSINLDGFVNKGGFRKIKEPTKTGRCFSPEHNPPGHIVLSPGVYEYECPSCGKITMVNVPEITF